MHGGKLFGGHWSCYAFFDYSFCNALNLKFSTIRQPCNRAFDNICWSRVFSTGYRMRYLEYRSDQFNRGNRGNR